MNRQRPAIIIGDNLTGIFNNGIDDLATLEKNLADYEKLQGLKAAYLYGYSVFESTLFRIYSKVLKAFPQKARLERERFDNSMLFATSRTSVVVDYLCDAFSRNFGHDTFKRYLKDFNAVVGIDLSSVVFPDEVLDLYKSNRNAISHRGGDRAEISLPPVREHIAAARETLVKLRDKFISKYDKYTDTELIRKSCSYVFNMSDKEFDKCFVFSRGHVYINKEELETFTHRLSSSEAHCFLLFIANYSAEIASGFKACHLMPRVSLSDETIDRISFINDLFEEYPHLINR